MLLSRPEILEAGDIVSVRLVTGEEIIGKYVGLDGIGKHVRITQPIVVQMQMLNGGQAQLGFAPFAATAPDGTTFDIGDRHQLAKPVKVRNEVRANYIRMTTGLEVPAEAAPRLILP